MRRNRNRVISDKFMLFLSESILRRFDYNHAVVTKGRFIYIGKGVNKMSTQLKGLASIEKIIQEMTVEEKALLITGGSPFHSQAMPKYGIPALYMIDSCGGVNEREYLVEAVYQKLAAQAEAAGTPLDREKNGYMGGLLQAFGALKKMATAAPQGQQQEAPHPGAAYPSGIAYGATWDPELVKKSSAVLADEMMSRGIDIVLGPDINIQRDPRAGRLAECISEDPFLTGKIGAAQVEGIEGEGLLTDVKHFAANSQETDRLGVEEHISECALREIYLPAFKACADAGASSMMSAYNKVNGKPCAMNDWLLEKILRGEWGYDGFVISDWGASYDQAAAAAAGPDLTMPGPRGVKVIEKAVADGVLPMEKLDNCVRRFLKGVLKAPVMTGRKQDYRADEAMRVTEEAARSGMILLKNDGTLPLLMDEHVVFYGKRSRNYASSVGSIYVKSDWATNPYDRAAELLGAERVSFEKAAKDTACWIVTVGADTQEGADRRDLSLDEESVAAMEAALREANATGGKVVLVVNAAGPVDLSAWEEKVNAILCPFYNGGMGGKAVTDTLFGLNNPSGKLPLTWPKRLCDIPSYRNFPGKNKEVWYGEGIYVGYRWYDEREIRPAYPFGHGLSYTTFALHSLDVPETADIEKSNVSVSLKIKNTGSLAGAQVVQLYIHDRHARIDMPKKQLKAFQKVFLEPGEEKEVTFTLSQADFACYSMELAQWITQPGIYDLFIGTSAEELPLHAKLHVRCKNPFGYSDRTGVGAIAADERALTAVNGIIGADLRMIAKVALDYAPDTPFGAIWNGEVMKKHFVNHSIDGKQAEEMRSKLQEIFDTIEI